MATTRIAVAPMKVAQISKAGADFEIVEREIPKPGVGHVLIKVQACGVCHSDVFTKEGYWPGIQYPRVPGHEVAGIIDELGAGVSEWKKGQRVGVGWHGGHDGTCLACRRGDFGNCQNLKIAGISYDGGYQQYMVAPVEALTTMPESLSDAEAAPLLCAGITTFNALRHSGARPGDLVAVLGIGGLGHLGIQFANKFGYKVAAIGRGSENAALAKKLGASVYIDNKVTNAAEALQKLGGAQVILATAPSSKAMSEVISGLGPNGKLMVVGAAFDPIEVTPVQLISGSKSIQGWASGTAADAEDTLRFAHDMWQPPNGTQKPLRGQHVEEQLLIGLSQRSGRFAIIHWKWTSASTLLVSRTWVLRRLMETTAPPTADGGVIPQSNARWWPEDRHCIAPCVRSGRKSSRT